MKNKNLPFHPPNPNLKLKQNHSRPQHPRSDRIELSLIERPILIDVPTTLSLYRGHNNVLLTNSLRFWEILKERRFSFLFCLRSSVACKSGTETLSRMSLAGCKRRKQPYWSSDS
uniref:Uncharacterized protein n=1 Tax=Ombrophytum subterraneum TaxID=50155 RepID=A0A6M8PL79_9MAGN|nr:hypothetical protein [Ombrophytum subterraneum]